MGEKGQTIGKKDEKDKTRVIFVPRSFARPLLDGKLKKTCQANYLFDDTSLFGTPKYLG